MFQKNDFILNHESVCPYGDYYDPVESNYNDGDVEVFETFVDPFTLRDSSARDPSTGMDIVLNIRHDFNLDVEDITGLLLLATVLLMQCHDKHFVPALRITC